MKASAIAHPIQGLIKYHGLADVERRIPFHDSISVCIDALHTITTVELDGSLKDDLVIINGKGISGKDKGRVAVVLDALKDIAGHPDHLRVMSENNLKEGKGLGFSASGFAALGVAASKALGVEIDDKGLSEVVRLGAGSATRSLAGRFAIWYANREGRSYAEQLVTPSGMNMAMVIVPIASDVRTDEAHAEVLGSPLFEARLRIVDEMIEIMKTAIEKGDISTIGHLAEEDTLNLHAITMTGRSHMILWEPNTIRIIREVLKMRQAGIQAWFSIDTGPSVFINTLMDQAQEVTSWLRRAACGDPITSKVGDAPKLIDQHLF